MFPPMSRQASLTPLSGCRSQDPFPTRFRPPSYPRHLLDNVPMLFRLLQMTTLALANRLEDSVNEQGECQPGMRLHVWTHLIATLE